MNIMTIFTTSILIIIMLSGMAIVGNQAFNKNPYLDTESQTLISGIDSSLNNGYTYKDYGASNNPVTNDSSFEDVDPFARQYLEDKSEIQQKEGLLNKATNIPYMVFGSLGVSSNEFILILLGFLGAALILIISLAVYKAIRTGETNG